MASRAQHGHRVGWLDTENNVTIKSTTATTSTRTPYLDTTSDCIIQEVLKKFYLLNEKKSHFLLSGGHVRLLENGYK